MPAVNISPSPKLQFFDANGNPLAGGKLYTYASGTTTPQTTYTSATGITANTNPVILDSRGEANVWMSASLYTLVLRTATDVLVWTVDGLNGPDQATLALLAGSGGSALIGYSPGGTGSVTTTVQAKLRQTVSVKDYGAVGDGTTDDTTAIQNTISAVGAAGGGTVLFPAGTYKTTSQLTVNTDAVFLTGVGRKASVLAPIAMATDHILFDAVSQGGLSDMAIIPSGAQTGAGAAIRAYDSHNIVLDNFWIYGNCQNGVICDGGVDQFLMTVSNFEIGNCAFSGIAVGTAANFAQDITIINGIVAGCYDGILLSYCSGIYITNVDLLSCTNTGLAAYPATSKYVTACFLNTVVADNTSTGPGFGFFDNGGKVTDINMVNCWAATCNLSGVICSAACDGISITGSRFINNQQNGIFLQGGTNYTITGNQIGMNSMQGSGLYHGVAVAANVSHFTVESNFIGGPLGRIGILASNLQGYGVFIATGTSNFFNVLGNDLTGNVTGALLNGGTGTTYFIDNNLGATGGTGGVSLTTQNNWTKTQRVVGLQVPTSGQGIELAFDTSGSPTGYLISYDRGTSAWRGMNLEAGAFNISTSGSTAMSISTVQIANFNNSPTAPTPLSSDNSTKLATTAFVQNAITGGNRSYVGNGATSGSGTLVITFPTSFTSSSSYSIVGTSVGGYFVTVDAISASSATLTARLYSSNAPTNGIDIRWIAIGT